MDDFSLALSRFVFVLARQGGSCRLCSQPLTGNRLNRSIFILSRYFKVIFGVERKIKGIGYGCVTLLWLVEPWRTFFQIGQYRPGEWWDSGMLMLYKRSFIKWMSSFIMKYNSGVMSYRFISSCCRVHRKSEFKNDNELWIAQLNQNLQNQDVTEGPICTLIKYH